METLLCKWRWVAQKGCITKENLHWCEEVNRTVSVSSNSRESSCQMPILFIRMKTGGSSFSQHSAPFCKSLGNRKFYTAPHSTTQNYVSCEHLWLERVPKQSASERWEKMRNVTACEGRKSTKTRSAGCLSVTRCQVENVPLGLSFKINGSRSREKCQEEALHQAWCYTVDQG